MDLEAKLIEDRKIYDPPKLTTISLRPEEAVLGHCKTPSGGTNGSVCNFYFAPCAQSVGS
jgi:hypothetical protein